MSRTLTSYHWGWWWFRRGNLPVDPYRYRHVL